MQFLGDHAARPDSSQRNSTQLKSINQTVINNHDKLLRHCIRRDHKTKVEWVFITAKVDRFSFELSRIIRINLSDHPASGILAIRFNSSQLVSWFELRWVGSGSRINGFSRPLAIIRTLTSVFGLKLSSITIDVTSCLQRRWKCLLHRNRIHEFLLMKLCSDRKTTDGEFYLLLIYSLLPLIIVTGRTLSLQYCWISKKCCHIRDKAAAIKKLIIIIILTSLRRLVSGDV